MKSIVQIFQIESNEENIEFSKVEQHEIKDFGNGFFISKDGYIASVAHVINNEGLNSYALCNGNLHKIEIIEREFTERNESHNDSAIGKIDENPNIVFIEDNRFEDVAEGMNIYIKGYSRICKNCLKNAEIPKESRLIEIQSFCFDTTYYYSNARRPRHNFFTFIIDGENLGGLSGSPIINEQNNIVGIFKGTAQDEKNNKTWGIALHIRVIEKMFQNIQNNIAFPFR